MKSTRLSKGERNAMRFILRAPFANGKRVLDSVKDFAKDYHLKARFPHAMQGLRAQYQGIMALLATGMARAAVDTYLEYREVDVARLIPKREPAQVYY